MSIPQLSQLDVSHFDTSSVMDRSERINGKIVPMERLQTNNKRKFEEKAAGERVVRRG